MKSFTDDQICRALLNKGFSPNGGHAWCDHEGNVNVVNQNFIIASNTGGAIIATVEGGTINNEHPTTWFNNVKSEIPTESTLT